jgi:hypothetical protein
MIPTKTLNEWIEWARHNTDTIQAESRLSLTLVRLEDLKRESSRVLFDILEGQNIAHEKKFYIHNRFFQRMFGNAEEQESKGDES